ncbi:hypothetical protein [Planctomicrobium piriforme]|uniref:Uncharacterized protein n=1 Tax=Planctomicrobium piriforme TaxID=1576369 RepID=A0A1I3BZN8_9PLAN|nr:hypothetical protein [Planctomicrobium piriforme]SFH67536.1 hypothetical protein SAMN05421753_1029 [Planctomicrobium piriforme]
MGRGNFFLLRWLTAGVLIALSVSDAAQAQQADLTASALATTEAAEYRGRLEDRQIVAGKAVLEIVRHGEGTAVLDWSPVRIAMTNLSWEKQPLLAGTSPDQRLLVLTARESDRLSADWSVQGQQIGQTVVFDLRLPAALNSRLMLDAPAALRLDCSQGQVAAGAETDGRRTWTVELGGASSVTLRWTSGARERAVSPPRYEIETEHRARRDGIFIKSDITIEGPLTTGQPLRLLAPETLEIQSVTLPGGLPLGSTNLPFQRDPANPREVLINLDALALEPRIALRIRGFEPFAWNVPQALPRLRLDQALETKRAIALRVEPPLQLQSLDSADFLQTGLTSDDTTGETWRFEARDPNANLMVNISLPDSPLSSETLCLSDARQDAGWTAAIVTLEVENGSRFETDIQLPDDWKLIAVTAPDAESRIASWSVDEHVLHLTWQNALTRTSPRQVRLFARTQWRRERSAFRLSVPQVKGAFDSSAQYQLLLPTGDELQLLEGEGWRLSENADILPALLQLREVTERLPPPADRVCVTLKSTTESRLPRALVNIVKKSVSTNDFGSTPVRATNGTTAVAEGTGSPPSATLELLTMAGQSNQRECVQHAVLTFDRPVKLADLNLRLSPECRLSAVKLDDQSITVFRKQNQISIPAEISQATTIRLTYVTPAATHWLSQQYHVPLPETSVPVRSFRWSLDLPGEQRLSQVSLPGMFQSTEAAQRGTPQLFGPLSRVDSDKTFNPLSASDWKSLSGSGVRQSDASLPRQTWHFIAPTIGDSTEFVTWNVALARSYAWVALLACLLIGSTARLFRMAWLRKLSVVWLVLLVFLVCQASPSWALVLGGMLAGSLLSLAIPRRWIQQRDFLNRPRRRAAAQALAAVTSSLLIAAGAWGQPLISAETDATPSALIRSARYQLTKLQPVAQVTAIFEILTRPQPENAFVKLPLQDVVFPPQAECLVDGEVRAMIPAVSGDAVLINLQRADGKATGTPITGTDWTRHQVELSFSVRGGEVGLDGTSSALRGSVPKVLDSILTSSPGLPLLQWQRYGEAIVSPDQTSLVQLGGIGRLAQEAPVTSPQVTGMAAHSSLDVTALRIRCQTRITPGPIGWPALLPLTFPPESLVTGMTGSNLIDWIDTSTAEDPCQYTVRLKHDVPSQPLNITFEFRANASSGTGVTIPAIPLWGGLNVPHTLGLTGPPLTQISLPNRSGVTLLTMEEWQTQTEPGRARPAVAVQLKTPLPLGLEWIRMKPQRAESISETLLVRRDVLDYSAVVKINVSEVPTFRHQFLLDPAVHLESVASGQMGNDGAVRFTRSDQLLTLSIPGGQLGERVFHFKGRIPLSVDAWSPAPMLEPVEASLIESQLTINDETGWNVEMEGETGAPISVPANETGSRPAAVYRTGQGPRPRRVRITIPPSAIQASSVTLLKLPESGEWEQTSTWHLTSLEAPLKKVVFRVPAEMTGIRVRPALFQHSMQNDAGGTLVTVRVPERYASAATLTISCRFSTALQARLREPGAQSGVSIAPQIEVLSAQRANQYLLSEAEVPLQPASVGSVRVPATGLPAWTPIEWVRGVQGESLTAAQIFRPEVTLVKRVEPTSGGEPVIWLEETVMWPLEGDRYSGLSRLWLSAKGARELPIRFVPGTTIDMVVANDGSRLPVESTATGGSIGLTRLQGLASMVVYWTRSDANGELRLLEFGAREPAERLLAVVHPREFHLNFGVTERTNRISAWLTRWKALLDCWSDAASSLSMDAVLLQNLDLCQRVLEGQINAPQATVDQRAEYERLAGIWNERRPGFASAPAPQFEQGAHGVLTDLLEQPEDLLRIEWAKPATSQWTGHFEVRRHVIHWRLLAGAGVLIVLSTLFLWRFARQFAWLRELASSHPCWSVAVLGAAWWLWFSPSFFGLLLMLMAGAVGIATRKRSEQRPASAEA